LDTQFIKKLLDVNFYESNKNKLHRALFEDDTLELYDIIVDAHKKYGADLSVKEVFELWQNANPVAQNSVLKSMKDLTTRIEHEDEISTEVASDILAGLWQRNIGKKISQLGINLMEGKYESFTKLEKLIEQSKNGFMPTDFGEETTKDLNILLAMTSDEARFRFNINSLSRHVYGIGRQEFGIIFARPETGKTAFGVSLALAPGGFCDQGAKVAILGNEERTERTMLRAYQSWTGMTKEEITHAPHLAVERFELISEKLSMMNIQNWTMNEVEAYVDKIDADVVLIDQMDKVKVEGVNSNIPNHERLGEIYVQGRELFKRQDCAGLVMSQASADAEGKTILTADMMEGSKTRKYAEADLIIGIGKHPDNADGSPETTRYLTVSKNKLSGWHGTETCKIEPGISRYVD